MALCYINGMLSPPNLAYCHPDLANNYSVPQRVSVAVGTASWAWKKEAMNASSWAEPARPQPWLYSCRHPGTGTPGWSSSTLPPGPTGPAGEVEYLDNTSCMSRLVVFDATHNEFQKRKTKYALNTVVCSMWKLRIYVKGSSWATQNRGTVATLRCHCLTTA